MSLPFGSVGIVLRNQRRMRSEYDSPRDHIWCSGARAGEIMNDYDSCLLVFSPEYYYNCNTWRGENSEDPSYEVGEN